MVQDGQVWFFYVTVVILSEPWYWLQSFIFSFLSKINQFRIIHQWLYLREPPPWSRDVRTIGKISGQKCGVCDRRWDLDMRDLVKIQSRARCFSSSWMSCLLNKHETDSGCWTRRNLFDGDSWPQSRIKHWKGRSLGRFLFSVHESTWFWVQWFLLRPWPLRHSLRRPNLEGVHTPRENLVNSSNTPIRTTG